MSRTLSPRGRATPAGGSCQITWPSGPARAAGARDGAGQTGPLELAQRVLLTQARDCETVRSLGSIGAGNRTSAATR